MVTATNGNDWFLGIEGKFKETFGPGGFQRKIGA